MTARESNLAALAALSLALAFSGAGCRANDPMAGILPEKRATIPLVSLNDIEVPVKQSFMISGTLTDTVTNKPIPEVMVSIKTAKLTVLTDRNGRYEFQLPPDKYAVSAAKKGFVSAPETLVSTAELQSATLNLALRSQVTSGKRLLGPAMKYEAGATGLKLAVRDIADGKGIVGLTIALSEANVPGEANRVTGADGSFTDKEIPPGAYRVSLVDPKDSRALRPYVKAAAGYEYLVYVIKGSTTNVVLGVAK